MKMFELRELTNDELQQKLEDIREEIFNLRFQHASNRLENPMKIKIAKKNIAQIKTLLTEREKSDSVIRGNDDK